LAASIVTLQAPVPEQAPVHPTNVAPPATGVAVRVMTVPWSNVPLQAPGQLMLEPETEPAAPLVTATERT
jgi:hypothetical protein